MTDPNAAAEAILQHLQTVAAERSARDGDAALAATTSAVKHFQQARFAATYAQYLVDARYAPAARFFLDELYGPGDFTARDAQFARIVPALVRLFPREIVATVATLAQLHALSEQLDTAMARALGSASAPLDAQHYTAAWCAVGRADARAEQVALVLQVGRALDRYTRKPLLRQTLKLMRGPAEAAGLGALQRFLERGFDAFRSMGGADRFLQTVAERETELGRRLFNGDAAALPPPAA